MRIPLDGDWTISYGDAGTAPTPRDVDALPAIPARVPGNIELELQAAGLAPDPAIGDGAWRLRPWEERCFWYRRRFELPALPPGERGELAFGAIDGIAAVWLDGVELGRAENALIPHRFALPQLRPGPHELAVRIESPTAAGRARAISAGEYHTHAFGWESLGVRKPGHEYGWDILPRLVLGGLTRGVAIEAVPPIRFREAHWATRSVDVAKRRARLSVTWDAAIPSEAIGGWRWRLRLERDGRTAWAEERPVSGAHVRLMPEVEADLWWPRGWGEPTLHDAIIELVDQAGVVRASDHRRIGLRTVELRRADAVNGARGDFCLIVNGERLFARGTNWVPLDALHSRDHAHRDAALDLLWRSGGNCLRMWGGSIYEDDVVYDWCDERGILVWQDFALACAAYPQHEAFRAALRVEAETVIRRLRHHACLALWCGGNETDQAMQWAGLGQDPNHDALSREVLPEAVRAHDPLRAYLPSSPYLSPAEVAGAPPVEDHLWGPRDDWLGAYYTSSRACFVSEIGWHGCPAVASLAAMQPPGAALWPIDGNPIWLPQAVCGVAEDRAHAYRLPLLAKQAALACSGATERLEDFVFASQTSQAEALKAFIERARARKGAMWGLLWWNLRDGWPVISDAIVDFFGRRKLAFEVVARAQAEVAVIVEQPADGRHRVVAVNDLLRPVTIRARVVDEGERLLLDRELTIAANGIAELGAIAQHDAHALWRIAWSGDAQGSGHYLCGPRPWRLADLRRWYAALGIAGDGCAPEPTQHGRAAS
jgi:beta-mannosidase